MAPSTAPGSAPTTVVPTHSGHREVPSMESVEFTQEAVRAAGEHFTTFFDELGQHMIEREDLLAQMQLALLAGQHVVIVGHPGTAKSAVTRGVLDRIVDEEGNSGTFFAQFHVESRRAELVGPKLPKTTVEGEPEMKLLVKEGLAPARYAFIDEGFDAPPAVLRGALLVALQDREILDGGKRIPIELRTMVIASNKTLEELRQKFGNEADAVFDRFAFVYYTPKRTLRDDSAERIMAADGQRIVKAQRGEGKLGYTTPPLRFKEMDLLKQVVQHIQGRMVADEWPIATASRLYRDFAQGMDHEEGALGTGGRSKMESQRTQNLILRILPAIAARRYLRDPESPLAVIPEDLKELRQYMMMRGPLPEEIPDPQSVADRADQKFMARLLVEARVFQAAYERIVLPQITRLERAAPSNFGPMREAVDRLDQALQAGQTFTSEAIQANLGRMNTIIGDLQHTAPRIPRGEEVFARAVSFYFRLLAMQIDQYGQVGAARQAFQAMQPQLLRLRTSFFRGPVEEAVNAYKEAIKQNYEQKSGTPSADLRELLSALVELGQDAEVLGSRELVDALRTRIKSAALDRALALGISQGDVDGLIDQFNRTMKLQRVVATEGIAQKIPVERLVELHANLLSNVEAVVAAVEAMTTSALSESDLRAVLGKLEQVLEVYEEEVKSAGVCTPTDEQIPEDALRDYLEKLEKEKKRTMPAKTVSTVVRPPNGDETVEVEWRFREVSAQMLDRAQLSREFDEHLRASLLGSPEALLSVPQIEGIVSRMLLRAKVSFGASQFTAAIEGEIRTTLLEEMALVIESKTDGRFEFPLQPRGIVITPISLKAGELEAAVEAAIQRLRVNETALSGFLEEKNIASTVTNLGTMRTFLNESPATAPTGPESVDLESETVELETYQTTAIVAHAADPHAADWGAKAASIEARLKAIGDKASTVLVDAHLAQLAASTSMGGVADADAFAAKYQAFLEGSNATASAVTWKYIPIDLSGGGRVSQLMEQDLAAVVQALPAVSGLESVIDPMSSLFDFVDRVPSVGASLKSRLIQVGQGRLTQGMETVKAQVVTAFSRMSATASGAPKDGTSIEEFITQSGAAMDVLDGLSTSIMQFARPIATRLEIPTTVMEQQEELLKAEIATGLEALLKGAVEELVTLEMPNGFKMNDLNTLTSTNLSEVEGFMMGKQFIRKLEEMLGTAVGKFGSLNNLAAEIATLKGRLTQLKTDFVTRSTTVRRSAI